MSFMFFPLDCLAPSSHLYDNPADVELFHIMDVEGEARIRQQCRWRQLLIRVKILLAQMEVLAPILGPKLQGRVALLLRVKHFLGLENIQAKRGKTFETNS